ncbi:PREDICTED: protein-glutamine gamma-glutamyltransferase 4 [Elephantulus edwardii]|uniref:protein-glutamine gamma-glutamyltransferase 4 n=1 Tax=Elephantulus edwardii TaxID=28737 RepID=UPI0003F0C788|nr:PREDICTED: protein-glutamine gamma-glutamyltransferase 4 [Elephantulus edwardii]
MSTSLPSEGPVRDKPFPGASGHLKIHHVDLMKDDNAINHHTSDFISDKLIVRRGKEFHLRLLLNHTLQSSDSFEVQLITGPSPNVNNKTLLNLNPKNPQKPHHWHSSIYKEMGSEVILSITSPPSAIVGIYSLQVGTDYQDVSKSEKHEFYLLYNPWCEDDVVYMPIEEERAEYVLNDTGYVYMGDFKRIQEKPWIFGQFEENVLSCCMYLLSRGLRKITETKDPVLVTRAMSAMMSSQDDNGVLVGNWSGDYKGGVAPFIWNGSAPILQQYYTTKMPVCFGQCWVFSGILTTVLRALGIPARSVTTYQAAHDTEKNLTVDIYMDENGKVSDLTNDSVWNFHVWTEAWMKRKDLPKGFDGWQAVDGTPQERSFGIYCCGPSPVSAIRSGEIFIGYDTKFIFSEVNADQIVWLMKTVNGKKYFKKVSVSTNNVGRSISTKEVGHDSRRDITNEYKFPEGSLEERKAMDHAYVLLDQERNPTETDKETLLKILAKADPVLLGEPVKIVVTLQRNTATTQTAKVLSSFDLQSYTGSEAVPVNSLLNNIEMKQAVTEFTLTLDPNTYMKKVIKFGDVPVIKGLLVAEIINSKASDSAEVYVHFKYPKISIEIPSKVQVGSPCICTCTIHNILNIPLTNAKFHTESLGLSQRQIFHKGVVEPQKSASIQVKCNPTKPGEKKLIIKFFSNEVKEIYKEKIVHVTR